MPGYKEKKQRLRELVKQEEEERVRKIEQEGHKFVDSDLFKRQEKHYKYYVHLKTDYSRLLRLEDMKSMQIHGYKVYALNEPEGAYLVKNFLTLQEQYTVGFQALNQYIFRPYRTNLDGTNGLYHQNAQNKVTQKKTQVVVEKENKVTQHKNQGDGENQEQQHNNKKGLIGKQIDIKLQNSKILENIDYSDKEARYYFNEKIRMSNLGFQYDWPHRSYPATRVSIPETITQLTQKAATLFQHLTKDSSKEYHGEAVIINYYKVRDYMTGHLDDGEEDQQNPIFSFCFGLSCVFLIGAPERNKEPVAVRLDAGDLFIMSGYSRICYHGVPRIIEDSYRIDQENQEDQQIFGQIEKKLSLRALQQKEQLKEAENIDKRYLNTFEHIKNYFAEHRLNINVRQVWMRHKKQPQLKQQSKNLISKTSGNTWALQKEG